MAHLISFVVCCVAFAVSTQAAAAPITFEVGGSSDPSSIQGTVDAFRAALGSPNNGNAPGPLAGGRREINWDGGGISTTTTSPTPFDGFLNTRGARFATSGSGFTQATPGGFGNPTYATTFSAFSAQRLFAPVGSNVTDVLFFLPGGNGATPAFVTGFGAVFTDVDLAGITTISFFDDEDTLLYSNSVEVGTVADGSLSFLGVIFNAGERIARVRITTGNSALGPNDGGGIDVVAMDDFLYSEPAAVPEPSALSLLGLGALALFGMRRRVPPRR